MLSLEHLGYPGLFLLVAAESAGVPLPGETALIAAGVLTSQGHLSLPLVISVAAGAAVAGDNLGYVLGRKGLRKLILQRGPWLRQRRDALERGERFFARHGGKAVFFGRFVTGVRVFIAWVAGAERYPWLRFALYNALGAAAWAAAIGVAAHFLGVAIERDVRLVGLGLLALGATGAAAFLAWRAYSRRRRRRPTPGTA